MLCWRWNHKANVTTQGEYICKRRKKMAEATDVYWDPNFKWTAVRNSLGLLIWMGVNTYLLGHRYCKGHCKSLLIWPLSRVWNKSIPATHLPFWHLPLSQFLTFSFLSSSAFRKLEGRMGQFPYLTYKLITCKDLVK